MSTWANIRNMKLDPVSCIATTLISDDWQQGHSFHISVCLLSGFLQLLNTIYLILPKTLMAVLLLRNLL